MPVVYLVTSHTNPNQVLRLAEALREGSAGGQVVIHHDANASRLDRDRVDSLGAVVIEPAAPVEWGRFSHVEMLLRCFDWLLQRIDFGWVVLLSGQDYPIRPIPEIEARLATSDADAFIEVQPCHRPAAGEAWDEFAMRYHSRWLRLPAWVPRTPARLAARRLAGVRYRSLSRSGDWVGVPRGSGAFGAGVECFRGADWFTLSRSAVEALGRFGADHPEVPRHYRTTLVPSESYIQTALANSVGLRLSQDTRRFSVWSAPHATGPRVLGVDDLDSLKASGCDFARKFDVTVDSRILDVIDGWLRPRASVSQRA